MSATRRPNHRTCLAAWLCVACLCALPGVAMGQSLVDLAAGETLYALNGEGPPKADGAGDRSWDDDADWLGDDLDLESEYADLGADDPLEKVNRGIFAFNEQIDRFALTPITDVYQAVIPPVLRKGIYNVFVNLDAPVRITNALLQGRPKAGGIALARFITNSTLGAGGLFEAGERVGLHRQQADFGMTLAKWGAPQGAYMMVPLLGPTTVRGGLGMGVDFMMQPVSWVIGPLPGMVVGMGKDFSRREQHFLELASLRDASLDYYAALRSAFLQDRADLVSAGMRDAAPIEIASEGSEELDAATLEARCLDHPRTRREWAKPALRPGARARCERFAQGL